MFGLSKISWESFVMVVLTLCAVYNAGVWLYFTRMGGRKHASMEKTRMQKFEEELNDKNITN